MNKAYMANLLLAQAKKTFNWQTAVVLGVIILLITVALIKYIVDKKKGKRCAGGCAGCAVSNCPSKKPLFEIKETEENKETNKAELKSNTERKEEE